MVIFQAFDTADGQVIVAAANDRLFAKLAVALGRPEWAQDPRYKTNADRYANKDVLVARSTEIMRQQPSEVWVARLEKAGVPCAPINDMTHMKAHPQTAALGMLQPVPEIDLDLMACRCRSTASGPRSARARPSSASTTPRSSPSPRPSRGEGRGEGQRQNSA